MSKLVFTKASQKIVLLSQTGTTLAGPFDAANNVDSRSKGPWPAGTFKFIGAIAHSELTDPESAYGEYGILIFDVPGRSGMGVHSGRRDIPDGLGHTGFEHCTMGCIRTTDPAMWAFLQVHVSDAIESIAVIDGATNAGLAARVELSGIVRKAARKKRKAR